MKIANSVLLIIRQNPRHHQHVKDIFPALDNIIFISVSAWTDSMKLEVRPPSQEDHALFSKKSDSSRGLLATSIVASGVADLIQT